MCQNDLISIKSYESEEGWKKESIQKIFYWGQQYSALFYTKNYGNIARQSFVPKDNIQESFLDTNDQITYTFEKNLEQSDEINLKVFSFNSKFYVCHKKAASSWEHNTQSETRSWQYHAVG